MKKIIIGLLVTAGIAALILPKFIGSQGTKMHNDFFQERAQQIVPGVVIESENISTGWFNSEGQQRVKLSKTFLSTLLPGVSSIELDKDVDVLVSTKFHHGPFAFTAFNSKGRTFSPVLAVAESTFKIEANGTQTDFPGTLYTQLNPLGTGGKAKYIVAAYSQKLDDAQVDFEGLELDFAFSNKGNAIDASGTSGKLSIAGPDGATVVLNKLQFKADLEEKSGLMFGDVSFKVGDFSLDDAQGTSFTLNAVDIKGGNKGDSQVMKSDLRMNIGELTVSDMKFEDFKFNYIIDHIDTQAMIELQTQSETMQAGGTSDQAAMMEAFKKVIERSPKIDINELSVITPQGKVSADLHIGFPLKVDMGFFPLSLLPQIRGDANVRVPMLVIQFIDGVKPGIANQVYGLSQAGMIELQGDDYVTVFKMRDGEVTFNGNPMAMPGM